MRDKLNWDLLRQQKAWLLTQDNENAVGLVHLIDVIQDEAVKNGDATEQEVFGVYPDEDE